MAKWKSKTQQTKSVCAPPPPLPPPRASVGFTKDIFSTFLFSWIKVMLLTPLYTCIQATIFKSLHSDFQTVYIIALGQSVRILCEPMQVVNFWQWWRKKKKGESWSCLQLNDNDFTLVLRLSAVITNSERPSIYVVPKISVNCVVLEHVE